MLSPNKSNTRERKLTAEYVRSILDYDRDTGLFCWKRGGPGRSAGSVAGSLSSGGYWRVKIQYLRFAAGRLAWLYVMGEWPTLSIDHIDGNRSNDRWTNLRLATLSQNNANRRCWARKQIQIKGIYRKPSGWEASIQREGRSYYLGKFENAEDAQAAYVRAATELFSDFARID